MNPVVARVFVVASLAWLVGVVIDLGRYAASSNILVHHLGLAVLGVVVFFVIAFSTQWLIDCIEDSRQTAKQ